MMAMARPELTSVVYHAILAHEKWYDVNLTLKKEAKEQQGPLPASGQ